MLRDHGEELEADFQRHYHLDLHDLRRGRLTPRRAAVLAVHLPYGAVTWIAAGSDAGWSTESHLLASVIDVLRAANWQRAGDDKAPRPEPVLRPSGLAEQEAAATRNEARAQAFLERRRRRQEQTTTDD